jgi:hypothetical protein
VSKRPQLCLTPQGWDFWQDKFLSRFRNSRKGDTTVFRTATVDIPVTWDDGEPGWLRIPSGTEVTVYRTIKGARNPQSSGMFQIGGVQYTVKTSGKIATKDLTDMPGFKCSGGKSPRIDH